ncbi:MAG: 4Fe-4S dicluster domain-containing protein [Clostridia bacterium]|nr:4Fe-4S dicluster domain-containing protein [Clostridia bacterium]
MYKHRLDDINTLFAAISKERTLYIPKDREGGAFFSKWSEGDKLSNKLKTVRSAKDFFFPQTETIAEFKVLGKNIEIIDRRCECEDFAIFGVRACDLKSFEILDRVFLSEPVDTYYKNRREHSVVMTLACERPEETCFCTAFGIDPSSPRGDIECYTDSEYLYLDPVSEKGKELVAKLSFLEECDSSAANNVKSIIKERAEKLPLAKVKTDAFGEGKTAELFNREEWAELSESCLGCGTCTFVCPTCQCYDIKDYSAGGSVERFRCWDSCMYSDFTLMAHGNSRNSQKERFRQRFMHKLVYYPENNEGIFGCVGCGRCVERCPISMNIVKVMKKLGGE